MWKRKKKRESIVIYLPITLAKVEDLTFRYRSTQWFPREEIVWRKLSDNTFVLIKYLGQSLWLSGAGTQSPSQCSRNMAHQWGSKTHFPGVAPGDTAMRKVFLLIHSGREGYILFFYSNVPFSFVFNTILCLLLLQLSLPLSAHPPAYFACPALPFKFYLSF